MAVASRFLLIGLIPLLLFFAIRYLFFPSYEHRFRLTVEIEADGQLHSGSSVIAVTRQVYPAIMLTNSRSRDYFSGQSPLVDLGRYGIVLVALSRYPGAYNTTEYLPSFGSTPLFVTKFAYAAIYGRENGKAGPELGVDWKRYGHDRLAQEIQNTKGKLLLRGSYLPGFIWLSDRNEPSTAKPLLGRQFEQMIGSSVHIRAVYLEMTDDPVINHLFKELPWFAPLYARQAEGETYRPAGNYKFTASQISDINY